MDHSRAVSASTSLKWFGWTDRGKVRANNEDSFVGLQFDAPLTRLGERNVYRQSLIEFQQARRTYYQFRDRVQRDVRATLRQLQLDDLNFELRRAAVHVAITLRTTS